MNPMLLDDHQIPPNVQSPINSRREAREAVLKILYAHTYNPRPLYEIIEDICGFFTDAAMDFIKRLSTECIRHEKEADEIIRSFASNWEFDRIAVIDRLILRIGICEFLYFEDIPCKVTINEAIEIGKRYSTDKSGHFLNGMLDAIRHHLSERQMIRKSALGLIDRKTTK